MMSLSQKCKERQAPEHLSEELNTLLIQKKVISVKAEKGA